MTARQLVDKQIQTIRIVDGNTEIHHVYYELRFGDHTVWRGGSDNAPLLRAEAQRLAKGIVRTLHRQAELPVPELPDIPDFAIHWNDPYPAGRPA